MRVLHLGGGSPTVFSARTGTGAARRRTAGRLNPLVAVRLEDDPDGLANVGRPPSRPRDAPRRPERAGGNNSPTDTRMRARVVHLPPPAPIGKQMPAGTHPHQKTMFLSRLMKIISNDARAVVITGIENEPQRQPDVRVLGRPRTLPSERVLDIASRGFHRVRARSSG